MANAQQIDLLNLQAWRLRVTDSEQAYQLGLKAYEQSKSLDYKNGLASALRILGFCQIRQARYNEAKSSLNQANILFTELKDEKGLASVYEYLGILDRIGGNLRLSIDHISAALTLSRKTNFTENEITNLYQLGVTYRSLGNFNKALEYLFATLNLTKREHNKLMEGYALNVIGSIYYQTGDYEKSLDFYQQGLELRRKSGDKWGEAGSLDNIGTVMIKLANWEEARKYCNQSLELCDQIHDQKGKSNALIHLAEININTNNWEKGFEQCEESLAIRKAGDNKKGQVEALLFLSRLLKIKPQNLDKHKVLTTLDKALQIAESTKSSTLIADVHFHLYEYFKTRKNFEKSLLHLEKFNAADQAQHQFKVDQKILNLEITHHAKEVEKEAEIYRLKNVELAALNKKIEAQKETVESTLQELITTQKQLIQSEKMASLGELTAGIAHEIQNPLNFVNNFADINFELLEELREEINKNKLEDAHDLIHDLLLNEEKIKQHGARAEAIVNGMLQHSRTNTGEKTATDLNNLADEYLRLSYHGLRAKDTSFNATLETDLDPEIGKIDLVPQDIGRVLLNILNNALYAVHERSKTAPDDFQPKIILNTRLDGNAVKISIRDNGMGIPDGIVDKIFQPFFTTKPTGHGTGLGLSLSYDIIKSHQGELVVESIPGEGSCFQIILPVI